MKTMEEVVADRSTATPMELALASLDMMTRAARTSVVVDDPAKLREALNHLNKVSGMMLRWLDESTN